MLIANINYGLVQVGQEYSVLEEGSDWYLIKIGGRAMYVFRWVFEE